MKKLLKFASRGRPEKFFQGIQNIYDTISDHEFLILASFDSDDASMNNPAIIERLNNLRNVDYSFGPSKGKIDAINRGINQCSYQWEILFNYSDDMKFIVKGWDEQMIKLIRKVWPSGTDFFPHFSDGYAAEKLPTMSVMGREYYERFFYVYPPCYSSFSCDAEAMYVAQMLGRHHYFPEVFFHHNHYTNKRTAPDKTGLENDRHAKADTATYFNRMKKMFYVNNPDPQWPIFFSQFLSRI